MAANTAQHMGNLPSGMGICTTIPDIFYIPELVFGGVTWALVASTLVQPANPLGWVMFVSIFCFVMTFLWMIIFACGGHRNSSSWATADFAYHGIAAFFYLSSSVSLAFVTITISPFISSSAVLRIYRIDIAAVVFSFLSTLLYFLHTIFSAMRWKSF
ncbi:myelin and lymphocyte protein-like [Conger conger]|uniref:myelin and lymphocyte protein-like n=1 Tax=Conger conger TaxID=82655 RepID=UPI002A5ADAB0|nr:myelin and lymphocyte protein-like [Conger conger]